MWVQLFIYTCFSSKTRKICRGTLVTWQKFFSLQGPPLAVLWLFLAEVNRPGPGCQQWLGCTRALYNKKLLMLLSWLVATLAYSPECLLKYQLGIVAFFPSHYAYLLLNSPCAASEPGTELRFPCIGWSWSHEGQGPLCSYKGPASCAVLEGPCAFKWVRAHQWAALHGLGKWNWDEGWHKQG